MIRLRNVLARALRVWGYNWSSILVAGTVWLLCQLLVIPGPPATAVFYALLEQSYDDMWWGPAEARRAARAMFWPAWKWALLNLLVFGLLLANLSSYWDVPGLAWTLLRIVWLAAFSIWVGLNFFYWPFWLAQEDQRMVNTYRNCGRFLLYNPLSGLLLVLLGSLLLVASVLAILPFILGSMALFALLGISAVRHSLAAPGSASEGSPS